MRKNITRVLSIAVLAAFVSVKSNAQTLIHYWNFNSFTSGLTGPVDPTTLVPIKATYSTLDTNKATIAFSKTTGVSANYMTYWDNYIPGDTINAQFGDAAGGCLRIWNPTDSMQLLFNIPTTGYKNITLKFETEKSSLTQAQLYQMYDYSTDSGATWKTSGLSIPGDSAVYHVWNAVTVTLNDADANNNSKLIFRIRFSGQNTGGQGNNRFDNVTVNGDSLNSTGIAAIATVTAYNIYPSPAHNEVYISNGANTAKTIVVRNIEGKVVFSKNATDEKCVINVAGLSSGIYFVTVVENESGYTSQLKFVKD